MSSSDESFEIYPSPNGSPSPDQVLARLQVSTPTWEEQVNRTKKLIEESGSTALKGIPGPLEEPDGQEDSVPAAQVVYTLPRIAEVCLFVDGDELSVFANLARESDGPAAETQASPCNTEEVAQAASTPARPPSFPAVSCKITSTGETVFSLQWDHK